MARKVLLCLGECELRDNTFLGDKEHLPYLFSGVHHFVAPRAYRWEFRRTTLLRAMRPTVSAS